ncbi:cytochrome c oxidase subunit II [Sphingobium sp.]|uniref:cytochrome c oxidase subunit II n=1 Tax=Sphingobium sp. TaxID=1912891 RepID=UPI002C736D8F|nr:cytochrome c oxidase subunit II [Sphingobium sp.]HUD90956.1 cytochrome c oxidase subunit II [Sphingobium sp.]
MRMSPFLALLLLGACSGRQTSLDPAAQQSSSLMILFMLMLWVCGLAYLLMLGLLGWSLIGRRNKPGQGYSRLFGLWIGFILLGLTVLVTGSFWIDRGLLAQADEASLHIRVTGHQWWWRIEYRTASGWVETANIVHLPLGRTATVELRSADVIHSFWLPNLAGKVDMLPGRSNRMVITPRRAGLFRGQCAEFCGVQHANMALTVQVEKPAAFGRWLAAEAEPAPSVPGQGHDLFMQTSCAVCHRIRGTQAQGRVGPDLTHIASRPMLAGGAVPLTTASLRGWIIDPQGIKPGTLMPAGDLSPQDAQAVARYLEALR